MRARLLLVGVIAVCTAAWCRPAQAQLVMPAPVDDAVADELRKDLFDATRRLADNDVAGADRVFDKVIASPAFAFLEAEQRYSALLRAGIAAFDLRAHAKA